jgi:hypothetical protein
VLIPKKRCSGRIDGMALRPDAEIVTQHRKETRLERKLG